MVVLLDFGTGKTHSQTDRQVGRKQDDVLIVDSKQIDTQGKTNKINMECKISRTSESSVKKNTGFGRCDNMTTALLSAMCVADWVAWRNNFISVAKIISSQY